MDTSSAAELGMMSDRSEELDARHEASWGQRILAQWPVLLVIGIALIVRLGYYVEITPTAIWHWEQWNDSDMDTFLKVARQILDGDLLVRNPYHPIHGWHLTIAPREDWEAWARPNVFYQVPGYYYLLALFLQLSSGSVVAAKVLQMVLGAIHASLLTVVGRRLLGRLGGLIVGLFAATYGPFIVAESILLRESIGLLLATLSFYLILRAQEFSVGRHLHKARLVWFTAGLLLGIGAVTKETGFVLFGGVIVWLLLCWVLKREWTVRLALSLVAVGFVLGLSPLILRNLAVGASPFAFSSNAGMTFMLGNAADIPSGGVNFFEEAPSFKAMVQQSHGEFLSSVKLTLRTYAVEPSRFVRNVGVKFSAIWSNIELPDNYSYDHVALHSPILRSLPRFVCVWLPAAAGLLVLCAWLGSRAICRWRHGPPSPLQTEAGTIAISTDLLGLILILIALQAVAMSLAPITARYRMILVPFLMLIAGWMIAQGTAWVLNRRWIRLTQYCGVLATVALIWSAWPPNPLLQQHAIRPDHFRIGARILADQGNLAAAHAEFELGITHFLSHGDSNRALWVRRDRLVDFSLRNHVRDVMDDLQFLSRYTPGDPILEIAARHLRQELNSPDRE